MYVYYTYLYMYYICEIYVPPSMWYILLQQVVYDICMIYIYVWYNRKRCWHRTQLSVLTSPLWLALGHGCHKWFHSFVIHSFFFFYIFNYCFSAIIFFYPEKPKILSHGCKLLITCTWSYIGGLKLNRKYPNGPPYRVNIYLTLCQCVC